MALTLNFIFVQLLSFAQYEEDFEQKKPLFRGAV